jgi:predicted permease
MKSLFELELGDSNARKEEGSSMRAKNLVEALIHDAWFAGRIVRKNPGFTLIAVFMVALGIGANAAIFSVVENVLLTPLKYRDPAQLVVLRETLPALSGIYPTVPANAWHYLEWRKDCRSFEQLAAVRSIELNFSGAGIPERLAGARVSANLFSTLGITPALGRDFLPEEEQLGRDQVAILTNELWRRRFSSDAKLVGRSITLDGVPHTVVGILPASFHFPKKEELGALTNLAPRTEVFKPLGLRVEERALMGNFDYAVIGRLRKDNSIEQAITEVNTIEYAILQMIPVAERTEFRASLVPLQEQMIGSSRRSLIMLLGLAALVLITIFVNLANLFLARMATRTHEIAIRKAMGASSFLIVRHITVESLLLSLIGSALGLVIGSQGLALLLRAAPPDLPRLDEVHLDWSVFLLALIVSVVLGSALGGLSTSWCASVEPQEALKKGRGPAFTDGPRKKSVRATLVAMQVALSTVLLITAGLLFHSFVQLLRTDQGFHDASQILTIDLQLPPLPRYSTHNQRYDFYNRARSAVRRLPGVISVALASLPPLEGEMLVDALRLDGESPTSGNVRVANYRFVSTNYFSTLSLPLLRGRVFSEDQRDEGSVVVSRTTAQSLWPEQDPIGKRIDPGNRGKLAEVIGVVADVRASPETPLGLMVYQPDWIQTSPKTSLVVRFAEDPHMSIPAVRAAIWACDSEVPIPQVLTLQEVLGVALSGRRYHLMLVLVFAALALVVAGAGVFGVVSYLVARRTSEIGVRIALGARSADILGMVLRQGLPPVLAGLALGVMGGLAVGRIVHSLLFDVSATDPFTIAGVIAVEVVVGMVACAIPAWQAMRVDPINALRFE